MDYLSHEILKISYQHDQVLVASTAMIIYFDFLCDFFISLHRQSCEALVVYGTQILKNLADVCEIVSNKFSLSNKSHKSNADVRWRFARLFPFHTTFKTQNPPSNENNF